MEAFLSVRCVIIQSRRAGSSEPCVAAGYNKMKIKNKKHKKKRLRTIDHRDRERCCRGGRASRFCVGLNGCPRGESPVLETASKRRHLGEFAWNDASRFGAVRMAVRRISRPNRRGTAGSSSRLMDMKRRLVQCGAKYAFSAWIVATVYRTCSWTGV